MSFRNKAIFLSRFPRVFLATFLLYPPLALVADVDLVIEFQRPIGLRFMELIDYLETLLDRKVDVLTPAGVQGIHVRQVAENISASIVYV